MPMLILTAATPGLPLAILAASDSRERLAAHAGATTGRPAVAEALLAFPGVSIGTGTGGAWIDIQDVELI